MTKKQPTTTTEQALAVARATRQDAYSRDRYTDSAWESIAKRLANEGASPAEIDSVLRSKYMRWAADNANRSHSATAADFARYVVTTFKGALPWQTMLEGVRADLAAQTPKSEPTGADLAGLCEGEDIAMLIDLVKAVREAGLLGGTTLAGRAAEILARIQRRAE